MIIFKELGRLGNQLFQYSALKTLCQHDENLILFGFEELQTAFDGIDATIINLHTPRIQRSLYCRFYKIADNLSKKKLFLQLMIVKTYLK